MEIEELVERYNAAWNDRSVPDLLRIFHPEGSYYDAFWGEHCSGENLGQYFKLSFETDTRWYRSAGDPVLTENGFILRYDAFDVSDPAGHTVVFKGADIITVSGGLILTVSAFYVDLNPADLIQVSRNVELRHARSAAAPLGMSARTAERIKRRLAELGEQTDIYLNANLTVTHLADRVDCDVMHLFHSLEVEYGTSFEHFVNECRARHATTLLVDVLPKSVDPEFLARACGFESAEQFEAAFSSTFHMTAEEYAQRFRT